MASVPKSKKKNKCTVYELCMKMIEEKNYSIVKSEPEDNTWNAFGSNIISAENFSLDRYIAEKFSFEAENCSTVKPEQQEKNISNELCLKISEAKSILLEEIETFSKEVKNCSTERCKESQKEANVNNLYPRDQVASLDKLGIKTSGVENVFVDRNVMDILSVKEELTIPDLRKQYIETQNKSNDSISYRIEEKTLSTTQKSGVSELCTQIQKKTKYSVSKQHNVETMTTKRKTVRKRGKNKCYRMSKCKFCKNVFSRKYFIPHIDKCTKKYNVWEVCKKVLAEKSNSQTSHATSEINTSDISPLKNDLNIKLNYSTENHSLIKSEASKRPPLKNDFNSKLNNLTENNLLIKSEVSELSPLINDLEIKSNNLTGNDLFIEAGTAELHPLKNDLNSKLNNLTENDSLVKAETENSLCCNATKNLEDVGFSCNECGIHFTEIKKFYVHHCSVSSEGCSFPSNCRNESTDELLICNLCGMCLNEVSAFQSHCHDHFSEEIDDTSRKKEKSLLCVMCGARFLIFEELKSHCLSHIHGKSCEFSEKNDLLSYCRTPVVEQSQIEVGNPPQSIFNTNETFYNNSVYVCSMCKIWFTDRENIFCHSLTHTGVSSKIVDFIKHYCFCITCGVYFTIEDFKQYHINHANYKSANFRDILMARSVCEMRGYGFPRMDEYDFHIRTRIKVQPTAVIKEQGYMRRRYICKICGLSFTKMETYDSHLCKKTKVQPKAVGKNQRKVLRKILPKAFIKEHEDYTRMPCICKHCGLGFTKKEMFESHACVRETEPLILYELIQKKIKKETKPVKAQHHIGRRRKKETEPVISPDYIGRKIKETNTLTKKQTKSKKYQTRTKSKKERKYFCC